MAESLTTQTVIAYSNAVESPYGTPSSLLASGYTTTVTRSRELPVTASEKTDDRGQIGRGNAMYPSNQRSGFRIPTAIELTDVVQFGTLAPLLRRYTGAAGSAPVVVEATKAWKHSFFELNPDTTLQLPSFSMVYMNNEYDWLLHGVCGSTLQFAQEGTADPTYTIGLLGSGMATRVSEIDPAFGTLPVPVTDPYAYGTSSQFQYTDDLSATISLTTPSHKWRSSTFSANNNLDTGDTRAGMPQVDAAEPKRGWYRDFLFFGDRDISFDFTTGLDGDFSLKNAEELNTEFTNLTWTMRGDMIPTTASSNRYALLLIIPKFNLRNPRSGETNNRRTKTFAAFPLIHGGHYGVYRIELINTVSTTIV